MGGKFQINVLAIVNRAIILKTVYVMIQLFTNTGKISKGEWKLLLLKFLAEVQLMKIKISYEREDILGILTMVIEWELLDNLFQDKLFPNNKVKVLLSKVMSKFFLSFS